ncbi:peptidylprolyl isomerase [Piscinibacter gummiphilus]|uniref:Chaperone SurA n=1 Tax=Piscinibacter gummiphilus TaxID=946333 RepID=A0A1W6LG81_9BURK|nr:peptidylprolyl isomerase [Piscinibacter gummiphilus]ARN23220.1 molecular chaperone SurA [Piscinibacter gummiphilus]ATU67917.1 molecular chaperone SurA [Piscinibacter gummiphilus]
MMSLPRFTRALLSPLLLSLLLSAVSPAAFAQARRQVPRTADYILAVVNSELVTANELELRVAQVRDEARRSGGRLPPDDELRRQLLDALIDERVQITYARDSGMRVEDTELERAVANIAAQNQLTTTQLRDRLRAEGIDYVRFRNNIRDQIMIERNREREVQARIKITDADIDDYLAKQRSSGATTQFNIAQVLVTVPEGATDAVVAERQAVAQAALTRIQGGEDFAAVARQLSEDANKEKGGEIGMRPGSRLPEVFLNVVRDLKTGQVSPTLLRTGAGFHILKVIERRDTGGLVVTQTRARHILLRPSQQMSAQAASRRLLEFKRQIESGAKTFDALAREHSEDGSGPQGGDLGWVSPGAFVPEFEEVMNSLPINGISDPVTSRFGMHLIQVMERRDTQVDPKQLREQARSVLRERKYEDAHSEWLREIRARAYIEMREPPQ